VRVPDTILRDQIELEISALKDVAEKDPGKLGAQTVALLKKTDPKHVSVEHLAVLDGALSEAMGTTHASILTKRILAGALQIATEPNYFISKLFNQVALPPEAAATIVEYPILGPLRAKFMSQGMPYETTAPDAIKARTVQIKIRKVGIALEFTHEMLKDSLWDVMGVSMKLAGQAMARVREEWCDREMKAAALAVFDNSSTTDPTLLTTGRDRLGDFNNTMSIDDYIKMIATLILNDFNATHVLMHPLTWLTYAQTALHGGLNLQPENISSGFLSGFSAAGGTDTGVVSGQVPFLPSVVYSPFIELNKITKTTTIYAVDATNLGVIVLRESLQTDQFSRPWEDMEVVKMFERYGVGILNQGRAITCAKNIVLAPSYPFRVQLTKSFTGPADRS